MTLEQFFNENYVLSDGEVLSIHIDNKNGTIIKIAINTRQYLNKNHFRNCKIQLEFSQLLELNLFDNASILGSYSDFTILKTEDNNYYASFDPFGNTNNPHENDNNVIISKDLEIKEIIEVESLKI